MPKKQPRKKRGRAGKKNLPSKGRDLQPHEKIELAVKVCELYATDQYTLQTCISQVGIQSDSTWYKWVEEIKEIEELYNKAKNEKRANYKSNLVARARTTLERYLEGYIVDLREQQSIIGKNEEQKIITKVKQKQVYVRPSLKAVEMVLYNFDGNNFTRNPDPYKGGNEEIPTDIQITIKGGEMPPITNEEDIDDSPQRRNRD